MQRLTVGDILNATNGTLLSGDANMEITGITTDSRKADDGLLFIPLEGETFDGHEFIKAAFDCGVRAVLTHQDTDILVNKTMIRVEDTFKSLGDIARYYKQMYNVNTVAVTGSVGKTTTKDMLASVLAKKYNTLKTQGNFNNEIGLPLTVFNLEKEHEMAVLEMGQNNFGEIHNLASIAVPDVAVITNIGVSHIENLGSQEGIFKAKMEITDFFDEKSVLIVNGDDKYLSTISDKPYKIIKFGITGENLDLKAYDIQNLGIGGTKFKVYVDNKEYEVCVNVAGEHNVYNALASLCVGHLYNISMDEMIEGIADFELTKMRMAIEKYGDITVINDCYNASPDSICASLKVLEVAGKGRKVAILGDILELGSFAHDAHYDIGSDVVKCRVELLITVGENAKYIAQGAMMSGMSKDRIYSFGKTREALDFVRKECHGGDIVLVKASRGMKFEMIVDEISKKSNEE